MDKPKKKRSKAINLTEKDLAWFDIARYQPLMKLEIPFAQIVSVVLDRVREWNINSLILASAGKDRPAKIRKRDAAWNPLSGLRPNLDSIVHDPLGAGIWQHSADQPTKAEAPPSAAWLLKDADLESVACKLAPSEWMNQAWLGATRILSDLEPESHGIVYLAIDCKSTDKAIRKDFSALLKKARGLSGVKTPIGDLPSWVRSWAASGAIPLIDIEFFRQLQQAQLRASVNPTIKVKVPRELIMKLIFAPKPWDEDGGAKKLKLAERHRDAILGEPYLYFTLSRLMTEAKIGATFPQK